MYRISPLLSYKNHCAHDLTGLGQDKEVAGGGDDCISVEYICGQQTPLDSLLSYIDFFLTLEGLKHVYITTLLVYLYRVKLFEDVLPHARVEIDANTVHACQKEVLEVVDEGLHHQHVSSFFENNIAVLRRRQQRRSDVDRKMEPVCRVIVCIVVKAS